MERSELRKIMGNLADKLRSYPEEFNSEKMRFKDRIDISRKFLKDLNFGKIVIFSENFVWEKLPKTDNILNFEESDDALDFLYSNASPQEDNYYVTSDNLDWMLVFCHEGDMHIYGEGSIVSRFKQTLNQ